MAFAHELERASQLAIPNVVVHPGAFTTSAAEEGLRQIADSLDRVFRLTPDIETRVLLENTAGQGSTLGWQFEQLAWLMQQLPNWENRLGVCIDTCHAFAAGYPLSDDEGFAATIADIERTFGIENIHALHLNDSKKPLGSRVDRHEHIGVGEIGLSAFSRILNHPKLRLIPMYLETEKGENPEGRDWDIVNLERLRACVQHSNKMA
jgi:deoxyribonuclease-4